jgi:hypothetical protein
MQDENQTGRDRYRDNDDVREPLEGENRLENTPDTKSQARGDARDTVGNTSRGTDTNPTGPEANDKTKGRPRADSFDADLDRSG